MKLTCPKCKYSWETKSKLNWITCPSCQSKMKNPEKKQVENK